MAITIDAANSDGTLVADNERYRIHDYDLGDLAISLTEPREGGRPGGTATARRRKPTSSWVEGKGK